MHGAKLDVCGKYSFVQLFFTLFVSLFLTLKVFIFYLWTWGDGVNAIKSIKKEGMGEYFFYFRKRKQKQRNIISRVLFLIIKRAYYHLSVAFLFISRGEYTLERDFLSRTTTTCCIAKEIGLVKEEGGAASVVAPLRRACILVESEPSSGVLQHERVIISCGQTQEVSGEAVVTAHGPHGGRLLE